MLTQQDDPLCRGASITPFYLTDVTDTHTQQFSQCSLFLLLLPSQGKEPLTK